MKCTSCHSELALGTRICKTCGHPVSVDPALEDLYFSRLAANASPLLVQKIRSAPYLAKERRTVTAILFTIANAEAFRQAIPEEERRLILNQALDRFASHIFQYEGTIAKLWENTVLAFFGAPISHENDSLRALHAALAILAEVKEVSQEIEQTHGIPLRLNMVLNAGPIVIGDIKSNLKFDFQSLENTLECMDVALRAAIPTCEVILLENAYRFIKPFVECEKLDDILCEEINATLHLWRLVKIIKDTPNGQRLPGDLNIPLVGRERELDQLLELTETVLAGLGRVGLVLGEPGIGKSRLILEWRQNLRRLKQPTQIRWITSQGLAFGRELAYHLLNGLLRSALDLPDTASSEVVKESLTKMIENMINFDQERHFLYLAHLLEIPLTDQEEKQIHQLNASELRIQYINAVRSFLRNLAFEQPLIIILEDLHWADASSIDLMIELLSMTSSSPILFCLVTRQDRESNGWQLVMDAQEKFGPRLTTITLTNLDEEQSQSMVRQMIAINEIPEVIRKIVLEKSEGNPFFIEELIRMLINEGAIIKKNDRWEITPKIDLNKVPDSLQGLLAARIDRLPPDARLTLRVASVIGKTFPEPVIESVMAEHAPGLELMEQLSTLESIGMVQVAQVHPELTYKFQHILLHDAAYDSIFEADRRELHLAVGQALEKRYPEQIERLASQLAYHYLEAQNSEKAYDYLDKAGHVAMDSYANAEAENYFNQALQLTDDVENLAHLYVDLGETLAQQAKHRQALQAWAKAIQHLRQLNHPNRLARIYARAARSAWWGYDAKRSLEICEDGLKAVEGAIESPDIAYLIHETGRAYLFAEQPDKARAFSQQALEMAKRLDAFDVQAEALATIGILPDIKPEQAIAALEMAVKISESHQLFGSASRAYINLAAVIDNLGEIRLARDYQKRAVELGNKAGGVSDELLIKQAIARASLWLADFEDAETLIKQMRQVSRQKDAFLDEDTLNALFLEGQLSYFKGDFALAMEIYNDLIDRSRQIHDDERALQANRALAEVTIESQLLDENRTNPPNLDIALSMIYDALRTGEAHMTSQDVASNCLLSNIYALKGNFYQAKAALETANEAYRSHPVMQDRLKLVLAQARLAAAQENFEKALKYLSEGASMLEKMEGRWWRARIWLEMGDIYLKRNQPEDIDQAQNLFRDALTEFKDMGVNYYPDVIIDKLRQVKRISRAQAIAHRKNTQELAQAGRVQTTFIPTQLPQIPGYEISSILLPARETSGDFYDFIQLEDGKLGIVVADVGDKGAGAALYMAMSRTLIRTYAGEAKLTPQEVIDQVNRRILADTQSGIFLTVVFGILDPQKGTFTYVNAGHNPPFLLKKSGDRLRFTSLEKTGTLVGIFAESTWESETLELSHGEVLVLYTDGITEAQNEAEAFYGNDRLIKALEDGFDTSAENFRNAILENVKVFTGTAPLLDDITLIVVSRTS